MPHPSGLVIKQLFWSIGNFVEFHRIGLGACKFQNEMADEEDLTVSAKSRESPRYVDKVTCQSKGQERSESHLTKLSSMTCLPAACLMRVVQNESTIAS